MGQIIAVVSGKGGTGKTSFVSHVGLYLAKLGNRVLCVDCDIGLRNLDIALGMSDCAVTDFTDVLEGRYSLKEAATPHPIQKNLYLLTAPSNPSRPIDADAFALFEEKGIFSQEVASSFRENILSRGGSEHPKELYRRFRGQDATIDAMMKRDGIVK